MVRHSNIKRVWSKGLVPTLPTSGAQLLVQINRKASKGYSPIEERGIAVVKDVALPPGKRVVGGIVLTSHTGAIAANTVFTPIELIKRLATIRRRIRKELRAIGIELPKTLKKRGPAAKARESELHRKRKREEIERHKQWKQWADNQPITQPS